MIWVQLFTFESAITMMDRISIKLLEQSKVKKECLVENGSLSKYIIYLRS